MYDSDMDPPCTLGEPTGDFVPGDLMALSPAEEDELLLLFNDDDLGDRISIAADGLKFVLSFNIFLMFLRIEGKTALATGVQVPLVPSLPPRPFPMKLSAIAACVALAASAVFAAPAPAPPGPVAPAASPIPGAPIPNQYIVVFKKHVDPDAALAHENWLTTLMTTTPLTPNPLVVQDDDTGVSSIAKPFPDFDIIRRYALSSFKGYTARIPEIVAKSLKKLPEVAYVEQDQVMSILDVQKNPPSWGLKRISSRTLPLPGSYEYPDSAGEGVDAYIIDTGCQVAHPEFEGRAKVGKSFSTDNNDRDGNGHGTHVSGTVAGATFGVAKKANLICVKVLNGQGSGSNSDVIAGIDWVGTHAPTTGRKSVANMSLGGGASAALDAAVRAVIENGVAMAVAAGNSAGDACKLSPARVREALTVAASDKYDKLASFSERGKCVDIIAPGVDITSSWNNGKDNTISGTSMASPHACGVLALAVGERNFSSVKELNAYVVAIGTRKTVSNVPSGTPNVLLYADVTLDAPEPNPEDPEDPPEDPEDPDEPGENVCPFPKCLIDPSCTSVGYVISAGYPARAKVAQLHAHTFVIQNSETMVNGFSSYKSTMSMLALCVGTAALTALTFGYHLGEVNQPRAAMSDCPNLPLPLHAFGLPDCIPMTDVQWGLFVSVFLLGGTAGGLSGGALAARLGRRRLLFVNNALLITSALILASASNFFWLCAGRVLGGIGAGIGTVAVPLLIAELSPVSLRGSLGALNQLAIVVGILTSQTLGVPLSAREDSRWRVLFLLGVAPPLVQCALLPFCVESPRWLVANRLIPDARHALQRLRGAASADAVEDELAELVAANGGGGCSTAPAAGTPRGRSLYRAAENGDDQETGGLMERALTPPPESHPSDTRRAVPSSVSVSQLFTIAALKRPLLACIGLQVTQQFSGINAAAFYSTTIFNQSYPPDVAIQLTLLVSFVNVLATLASLVLIERLGRRYLLLASELVQLEASPIFVVAGLMGFVGLFGIGLGAIPWLILPELVPGYAANTAVSVCSGFNWGCSWFVAFMLPILIGIMGYNIFPMFSVFLLMSAWFTHKFVPETKGMTPEEVSRVNGWI
ncbi:serine protease [Entophlyctis sp. JEL0112]|nr:serine protease [Entophlyctis sp. JEL0112]